MAGKTRHKTSDALTMDKQDNTTNIHRTDQWETGGNETCETGEGNHRGNQGARLESHKGRQIPK